MHFFINEEGHKEIFLTMTEEEALQVIQSLSAQIANKNPNSGRIEFRTDNKDSIVDRYFTISVLPEIAYWAKEIEEGSYDITKTIEYKLVERMAEKIAQKDKIGYTKLMEECRESAREKYPMFAPVPK